MVLFINNYQITKSNFCDNSFSFLYNTNVCIIKIYKKVYIYNIYFNKIKQTFS